MIASLQTFLSVILGAILATVGGFMATQMDVRIDRSRSEREAALLSGEILAAVGTLLRHAESAALAGTFLDAMPSRFLSFARREIDLYYRNRELIFRLADPALRARLHGFVIRLSIPLDRLAEERARYIELSAAGPVTAQQAEDIRKEMEITFHYLTESRNLIPELLSLLQPLARTKFDGYSNIDSEGLPATAPPMRRRGHARS